MPRWRKSRPEIYTPAFKPSLRGALATKQSIAAKERKLDCFVAFAPRNDKDKLSKNPEETTMSQSAKRVVLVSRPVGEPKASDFRIEDQPIPTPGAGEVLLRTIWLSLDPYMRGRTARLTPSRCRSAA
jgi:hypothetical protein